MTEIRTYLCLEGNDKNGAQENFPGWWHVLHLVKILRYKGAFVNWSNCILMICEFHYVKMILQFSKSQNNTSKNYECIIYSHWTVLVVFCPYSQSTYVFHHSLDRYMNTVFIECSSDAYRTIVWRILFLSSWFPLSWCLKKARVKFLSLSSIFWGLI